MRLIASFRYENADPVAIAEAVKGASPNILEFPRSAPVCIHAVEVVGKHERTLAAVKSWEELYRTGDLLPPADWPLQRDAKTALGDPRPLPFLKDILGRALAESKHVQDVIIFTNDDIRLPEGTPAKIRAYMDQHQVGGISMRRTESNGEDHMGRDLFAFRAGYLRHIWEEFPDYVIGGPVFDLGIVAMLRRHCAATQDRVSDLHSMTQDWEPADMPPGLALHTSHKSAWAVNNYHTHAHVIHNKRELKKWANAHAPEMTFTKGGNLR